MHDQSIDRDQRADRVDHDLSDQSALLEAVERAARLHHAPLPPGTDVVLCDAGALLLPVDDVILPWIRYHRSWEAAEAALIARLVHGGAFLDIGAHVGYHTLALLQHNGSVSRVVAVEASAINADLLRRNLSVNLPPQTRDQVAVVEAAAWDEQATLSIAPNEPGNSGDIRVRPDGDGPATVPAVRLDEDPAVLAAGRIDVIKLDLQGRDHRAVRGLHAVIQRDRPDLVVEFSPAAITDFGDDPTDALTLYRELGYEILPITDRGDDGPELSDVRLCERAMAEEAGLLTLWLRPLR
jgi:FkbM family methyltransferase